MAVIEARSDGEAWEYMVFAMVECGGGAIEHTLRYVDKQNRAVDVYRVSCPSRDEDLEFRFVVADKPDDAPGRLMFGYDSTPSALLDVGQWMLLLNYHRRRVEEATEKMSVAGLPGPDEADELLDDIWRGRAVAEELLKFIPAGADSFPDSAFWTPFGREMQPTLAVPGFSWRAKMTEHIDAYEQGEAAMRRRYAELDAQEGTIGERD
jgi:hypothetical protein